MKGDTANDSARTVKTIPVRLGAKEATSDLSVSSGNAASTQRGSSTARPKRQPARRASVAQRPRHQESSVQTRRGWRHSDTTVFVLGILLVGTIVYCGAVYAMDHHELRAWMVGVGFVLGIVGTLVLMDGGDD